MTTQKKTQTQAAQDVFKPVEEAVNAGKEQLESVVKASNEAATKQYEQVVSMAKEQAEKASNAVFKNYDEATTLNKANIDAVVQSSSIAAKGVESLSREAMTFAHGRLEANMDLAKKMFGAKTLREFFDAQTDFARQNFDTFMAESAKMTELSVKVSNEAMEPIQSQTNKAVEKVMKSAA
jgi:phasin family protein